MKTEPPNGSRLRKAEGLLPLLLAQQKQNRQEADSLFSGHHNTSLPPNHRCLLSIQATQAELSAIMSWGWELVRLKGNTQPLNAAVNYSSYKDSDPICKVRERNPAITCLQRSEDCLASMSAYPHSLLMLSRGSNTCGSPMLKKDPKLYMLCFIIEEGQWMACFFDIVMKQQHQRDLTCSDSSENRPSKSFCVVTLL